MIKLYADGASIADMKSVEHQVQGFTTNPTLMRKAGISNYEQFAKQAIALFPDKPISFEVFTDDFDEMIKQASIISAWGKNVYVKIPITDTHGKYTTPVIDALNDRAVKMNITAILTRNQVMEALTVLDKDTPSIISIFAGRIADTGLDPVPTIKFAVDATMEFSKTEILWASTREVYNIEQAKLCGCDIITVSPDILSKRSMFAKDLTQLSLETVQMFYNDAKAAGYTI